MYGVNDNDNLLNRDSLRSRGRFAGECLAGCSTCVGRQAIVPLNCLWKLIGFRYLPSSLRHGESSLQDIIITSARTGANVGYTPP